MLSASAALQCLTHSTATKPASGLMARDSLGDNTLPQVLRHLDIADLQGGELAPG